MAQRTSRIDGVRLYSDNLESDLSKASNTIKSYKKVETTTTTKTVVKSGSNPSNYNTKGFGTSKKIKSLHTSSENP